MQKYQIFFPMGVFVMLIVGLFFSTLTFTRASDYSSDYFVTWPGLIYDVDTHHTKKILPILRKPNPNSWKNAIAECQYILRLLVNHPKALNLCVYAEKVLKKKGWLRPYFENALRLYPQYPITHLQYGIYLADWLGEPKAGIARFDNAILLDPKFKQAYIWLEKTYISIGQPEKAQEVRDRASAQGVQLPIPRGP